MIVTVPGNERLFIRLLIPQSRNSVQLVHTGLQPGAGSFFCTHACFCAHAWKKLMDRDVADGHGLPEFATTAVPVAPSVWGRLRRGRHTAVSVPTSDSSADEQLMRIPVCHKHYWFPADQA